MIVESCVESEENEPVNHELKCAWFISELSRGFYSEVLTEDSEPEGGTQGRVRVLVADQSLGIRVGTPDPSFFISCVRQYKVMGLCGSFSHFYCTTSYYKRQLVRDQVQFDLDM